MKTRIVERTGVAGKITYVIQQPHFTFWPYIKIRTLLKPNYKPTEFMWVDAWLNSSCGAYCTDDFSTLDEAQKNVCYFDDSKCKDRVVR